MLDRPPVNALSMPLIDALLAALQKAKDDPSVSAVIIAACTSVLAPGLISTSSGASPDRNQEIPRAAVFRPLNDTQYRMASRHCRGRRRSARRRMTIAISCDMIMPATPRPSAIRIDVGLIPAIHFVQLPRLVGKHQAFGPLFLARPFDAATAFRMGLLSEVVPTGTALDRAREIARS